MLFKQRIVPIVFIFLLLFPVVFSACTPEEPVSPTEQTQTKPSDTVEGTSSVPPSSQNASKADEFLSQVESVDYGGKEFRIAAYRPKNIFPSESQDIIDDIVLQRNEKIEQQFHVQLVQAQQSGSDFFESLRVDKSAGIVSCDMVVAPVDMMKLFVTYSMYANVNTLGLDFSRPYYNQEMMKAASTGIITYAVSGAYTASPENSYCLFYNKTAYQANGYGDLLATVSEGSWTWKTLLDQSIRSLGKNTAYRMNYGVGSSADEAEFIRLMWASSDLAIFDNEPPYHPALNIDTTVGTQIINQIKTLRSSTAYYGADEKRQKSALESFASGELLFYVSEISDFANLHEAPFTVGIAPLPKLSIDQAQYSTYTNNTFQAVYVLDNCPDLAFTAKMIDALNAASYGMLDDAYLSLYMHMYLSSNQEGLVLRDIFSRTYADIGYILGDVYNEFASASTDMIYRAVAAGADFRVTYRQNDKQFKRFLSNPIFYYPEPSTAPQETAPASTVAPTQTAPTSSSASVAVSTTAATEAVATTAASTTASTSAAATTTSVAVTTTQTTPASTAVSSTTTTAAPTTSAPAVSVSTTVTSPAGTTAADVTATTSAASSVAPQSSVAASSAAASSAIASSAE